MRKPVLKPKLSQYFATYADYHRHPLNKLCHYLGIPLIVFHVVAMLDWIRLFSVGGLNVTAAMLMYPAIIGWYLTLDARLAVVMMAWYGLCFVIGWHVSVPVVVGIAVFAWAVQLLGHAIWEKRSPAFLTNAVQTLIGPMYFAALALGIWPPKKPAEKMN